MRLVDPGCGEISDRLTILSLKILFGEEAEKITTHFKAEHTLLLSKIRSRTLNGAWFAAYTDLAAVNAALWHREDQLRRFRNVGQTAENEDEIVECAFRIQELNDTRAGLIATINREAGDLVGAGEEKINA